MLSRIFEKMYPVEHRSSATEPSFDILTVYNNTVIPCKGIVRLDCKFGNSDFQSTPFYVVEVTGPAVLGLLTCKALKVVTLHCAVNTNPPAKSSPFTINCTANLSQCNHVSLTNWAISTPSTTCPDFPTTKTKASQS